MKYELMFPDQIQKAIAENWPVVMALGVLEYHAHHLAVGLDTLAVVKALEHLEKENSKIVILPPFYYGAASYAVAAPEGRGTIHVPSETLHLFARDLFRNLLRVGFRNTHLFVWHQGENFTNGMPTDLAFKLAAREAIFEYLEKTRGEGWWGNEEMSNYYAEHDKGTDPFSWILFHPLRGPETRKKYPGDHAGRCETALMMAVCPEAVDMKRFKDEHWFSRDAVKADKKYGQEIFDVILRNVRACLKKGKG